jgi:hypothetical protein
MFRFSLAALWLLCLALLERTAMAQSPFPADISPVEVDPETQRTLAKEWAKAKFEASQAAPAEVARWRLDTAREWFRARRQVYWAGGGTLELALGAAQAVAASEAAVDNSPAGRAAALVRAWEFGRLAEQLTAAGHEARRVPFSVYQAGRYARLLADGQLVEALDGQERLLGQASLSIPALLSLQEAPAGPRDEFAFSLYLWETRQAARDLFEVLRSSPADLARARLDAARGEVRARLQEYLAGRGTLFILLACLPSLTEAEHAVFGAKADSAAFREKHWEIARAIHDACAYAYEAQRVKAADLFEARFARLKAEARLVKSLAEPDRTVAPPTELDNLLADTSDPERGPFFSRDLAKAKFAVSQARLADLASAQLDAARGEFLARRQEYLAGRGTLDLLLGNADRLLEAKWAVDTTPAGRAAALEDYWQLTWEADQLTSNGYDRGRVFAADYFQARYRRLDTELRLIRERAAKPRP